MSAFIKNIQNTANTHNLWSRGSKILVGVSGGPDSACLLDVLVTLSKKYDWELRIAHVNYGLRDKNSRGDEIFVRSLAKQYNVKCSVLKLKITQHANLEEALRTLRYDFFEETRQKYNFDTIAVAHTLDDQAETVLMRLIRGSGLTGLRAMQPKTNFIIRPFLETPRKAVLSYLAKQGLTYRTDASNEDPRFLRNKIRHQLIPYLQENFNPSIKEVLADTARIIGEDYNTLFSLSKPDSIPFHHNTQIIDFKINDFLVLSESMQRIVLRNFFTLIRGNIKGIGSANIDEVLKMLRSAKSKIKSLSFKGFDITYQGTTITITDTTQK